MGEEKPSGYVEEWLERLEEKLNLNHYREISIEELLRKGEPNKDFKVRGKISSWNINGEEIAFSISDDSDNFLLCSMQAYNKFSMPNGREVLVYGWLAADRWLYLHHLFKVYAIIDLKGQKLVYKHAYL